MRKLIFITILTLGLFAMSADAQDCGDREDCAEKLKISNQRLNKVLDNLTDAKVTIADREGQITSLKKDVVNIKAAQLTPCQLAFRQADTDLKTHDSRYQAWQKANRAIATKKEAKEVRKEYRRDKKFKRGFHKKAVKSQCNIQTGNGVNGLQLLNLGINLTRLAKDLGL